jgi:hypothetical protein
LLQELAADVVTICIHKSLSKVKRYGERIPSGASCDTQSQKHQLLSEMQL